MVTAARTPDAPVELVEAVALSLVRLGTDTLGARLFRDVLLPELAAPALPPAPWATLARLLALVGVPEADRPSRLSVVRGQAEAALRSARATGLSPLTCFDAAYPELLRCIPDPPVVVWVRGQSPTLTVQPAVAVVGSRNATPEGLANARRLARGLSTAGVLVISGLARGIDAAAHRGALDGPGSTVAVLGNGADVIYPASHRGLAGDVLSRGCLVTEFPPGTPPLPRHFPLRNRIISGLSRAVVVVEASDRSGSLITARAALDQGREVLAVPGAVASGCHRGCHALIKDGARLVETVEDVFEEIDWAPARRMPGDDPGKSKDILGLAAEIRPGAPVHLDELAARTGRSAPDLLAELSRLELAGTIMRLPGGSFVRLD